MNEILFTKFQLLPDNLKTEALHYIEFLLSQYVNSIEKKNISKRIPKFGCAKGTFKMTPDFDEPLEMFNEYKK